MDIYVGSFMEHSKIILVVSDVNMIWLCLIFVLKW